MKPTLVILLTFVAAFALAQDPADPRLKQFNLENRLALAGYDAVSYFTAPTPAEGKAIYSWSYQGVEYRFASAKNRDLFKADPQKYEPQYGGWCAYAMGSSGEKVEVDPETFKIVDGKLYLFYNAYFNNTLKKWNADEPSLKKKADANWSKIITE